MGSDVLHPVNGGGFSSYAYPYLRFRLRLKAQSEPCVPMMAFSFYRNSLDISI